jgi:hypothetical protein
MGEKSLAPRQRDVLPLTRAVEAQNDRFLAPDGQKDISRTPEKSLAPRYAYCEIFTKSLAPRYQMSLAPR